MGTSLVLLGSLTLLLEKQNKKSKSRFLISLLSITLLGSTSGAKTGLEWLNVRSAQTISLRICLDKEKDTPANCLHKYHPIEVGNSDELSATKDLKILSQYLSRIS